jgi:hypothetical protein
MRLSATAWGATWNFPAAHRRGVAQRRTAAHRRIYQGKPWRALVHGRNGTWHAVAGAPSEAAAIKAGMKSCGQADVDCRLFAIGNFRVADDK